MQHYKTVTTSCFRNTSSTLLTVDYDKTKVSVQNVPPYGAVWGIGQLHHLYSQDSELSHATSCMSPHTAVVHWTQVLSLVVADLAATEESNPYSLNSRVDNFCQESFTTERSILLNLQNPMYIKKYCTEPTCETQWILLQLNSNVG
jgi:hypothetical protein